MEPINHVIFTHIQQLPIFRLRHSHAVKGSHKHRHAATQEKVMDTK